MLSNSSALRTHKSNTAWESEMHRQCQNRAAQDTLVQIKARQWVLPMGTKMEASQRVFDGYLQGMRERKIVFVHVCMSVWCVYATKILILQRNTIQCLTLDDFCTELTVFSSFNGLLISAHPHSRVKFWQVWHVYPSHSAENSIISWSYLYHFTSSFSIFSVARRDWSCWNLKMSSPFSGGCTEIWHSWRKIREMHNQGGESYWMMDTGIKILMHLHSRLQRLCLN